MSTQNDDPRGRAIRAANNMRDELHEEYAAATRAVILWSVLLVLASLIFAALTSRPLMRFTGEFFTAYLIGIFLHAALGLSMHMWKLGQARQQGIYRIFGLFVILLGIGILVIAYFRADMMIERGQPAMGAYLVSLFMAILEIGVPTLFGALLANAWLRRDFLAEEYKWARELARRMPTESDPMDAWVHEAYTLERDRGTLQKRIREWEQERDAADADRNWRKVKELEEKIASAKNQSHLLEDRLTRVEKWYPGSPEEMHRRVNQMLKGEEKPLGTPESS